MLSFLSALLIRISIHDHRSFQNIRYTTYHSSLIRVKIYHNWAAWISWWLRFQRRSFPVNHYFLTGKSKRNAKSVWSIASPKYAKTRWNSLASKLKIQIGVLIRVISSVLRSGSSRLVDDYQAEGTFDMLKDHLLTFLARCCYVRTLMQRKWTVVDQRACFIHRMLVLKTLDEINVWKGEIFQEFHGRKTAKIQRNGDINE